MKYRGLHFVLAFLLLVSAHIGTDVQTAVFDESDDVKIVTVHTSAHEFAPALFSETSVIERTVIRSQKKSGVSLQLENLLFEKSASVCDFSPSFAQNASSSRVLLLPKSLHHLIFLQTVI